MDKNIIVCNMRYQKFCTLSDNSQVSAYEININDSLNEIVELTFKYPKDDYSKKYMHLTNENLVFYDGEYYRIKSLKPSHDEDGSKYFDITCRHLSESLQYNTMNMEEQTPRHVDDLMKIALQYDENDSPTLGWSVGNITVNKEIYRGLEETEESVFTILTSIAETFDGILRFNSVTKTVDLLKMADENMSKFDLRVSKDLKNVSVTYDTTELVTRLYCFGGTDENGNELDIMSVNPTGKAYIENYDYYYNLGYTDDDIKNYPELFLKTAIWREDNYSIEEDLYNDGIKQLETMSVPTVDIEISALDLSQYGNYRTASLNVGDAVTVYDADLEAEFICNVTSISRSSSDSHILNIEVTNKIQYKNIIEKLFSTIGTTNTIISSGGKVNGSKIQNLKTDQIVDIKENYVDHATANETFVTNETINNNYLTKEDINNKFSTIETIDGAFAKVNIDLGTLEKLLEYKADNESVEIQRVYIHEIEADVGVFKDLTAENFTATNANIETLNANKANITDLKAVSVNVDNLTAGKADIADLNTTNATIANLDANKANVIDLKATNAVIANLDTKKANVTDLNATNAAVNNLNANKANVTDLNVTNANVDNLTTNKANVTDLNATNANIVNLTGQVADIDTLLSGNISSSNIQAGGITSDRLTIANGFISNAMIGNVDAAKVNAGTIDTSKVHVQSASGNLVLFDNTIQISDATRARVQIGKDTAGDYSIYVWDASGNIMFDALGIHESAIKESIIRNEMVSETANISGSKLNINSVISAVNGATTQIKGTKIQLDTENQTLDTAFSSLKGTVTDVGSQTETNKTAISTANGKIDTLISNTTITKNGVTTQLKDAYSKTVQDVSNISTQLNSQQTTLNTATGDITEMKAKQSSFDQSLNGFSTTVSEVSVTTANTAKNSIINMEDEYYKSTSNTILTGGSWLSASPIRDEGTYIWKRTLITHGDNSTEYSDPICITGDSGKDGENAIVLRIDSSRGNMFKNSSVNTVLTVSISNGSQKIIDYAGLTSAFGSSAYLEWSWKRINDTSFSTISLSDSRIKDNGFTFELSSEDVDTKVVFECKLNI